MVDLLVDWCGIAAVCAARSSRHLTKDQERTMAPAPFVVRPWSFVGSQATKPRAPTRGALHYSTPERRLVLALLARFEHAVIDTCKQIYIQHRMQFVFLLPHALFQCIPFQLRRGGMALRSFAQG